MARLLRSLTSLRPQQVTPIMVTLLLHNNNNNNNKGLHSAALQCNETLLGVAQRLSSSELVP